MLTQPLREQRHLERGATRPLGRIIVERQQTLWAIGREEGPVIRTVLVAFPDAVELEIHCGDLLRRRLRFLRDLEAVKRAGRIRRKLEARGYRNARPRLAQHRRSSSGA